MDFDSREGLCDGIFTSTPPSTPDTQHSRGSESTSTATSEPGSITGKRSHLQLLDMHMPGDTIIAKSLKDFMMTLIVYFWYNKEGSKTTTVQLQF